MKAALEKKTFKIQRLGSVKTEDHVRQAVASATLEGLKPSKQSIALVRAVATGKMTGEAALDSLRGFYARQA